MGHNGFIRSGYWGPETKPGDEDEMENQLLHHGADRGRNKAATVIFLLLMAVIIACILFAAMLGNGG